eukprot:5246945-Prymnesium_polylepis.1
MAAFAMRTVSSERATVTAGAEARTGRRMRRQSVCSKAAPYASCLAANCVGSHPIRGHEGSGTDTM